MCKFSFVTDRLGSHMWGGGGGGEEGREVVYKTFQGIKPIVPWVPAVFLAQFPVSVRKKSSGTQGNPIVNLRQFHGILQIKKKNDPNVKPGLHGQFLCDKYS